MNGTAKTMVEARDLTIGYGERVVLERINFAVHRGEVFAILGASGSGKSTLLKHLIGLYQPLAGDVLISGSSLVHAEGDERLRILQRFGVLYQGGALFGSLTTVENVRLPLDEFTELPETAKDLIALSKLRLVGLESSATKLPADLSGGMQKRAGIARAIVMDPADATYFGIDLFFHGSSTPSISAFGPMMTSPGSHSFQADSGTSTSGPTSSVPAAGTLSFTANGQQITLTDFYWATPSVYNTDQVSAYAVGPNGHDDYQGQIQFSVTQVPEPALSLWGLGVVSFGLFIRRRGQRKSQ